MTDVDSITKPADNRRCGSCTLCCKLVPVNEVGFHKPGGQRCPHQRHTGCSIYAKRPFSCRAWSCRWLIGDEDLGNMRRPDRCHYVVDIMADFVETTDGDQVPVIQVWGDTRYPDAHRDPALRAYLEKIGMPALIRFENKTGLLIVPPSRTEDGIWMEKVSLWQPHQHSADEINAVCGGPVAQS
jgi:hypothetical protein